MKTLIAIPALDMIHTVFFKSVIGMDKVGETAFTLTQSSLVYDARNTLARKAIDDKCDRILWLDSDMEFQPDLMKRLSADIDDGYEMVCGIFFKRKAPIMPVVYKDVGYFTKDNEVTPVAIPYEDYPKDQIFEIKGCGFGAVMMTVELLNRVVAEFGAPFSPILGFGEDLSFCKRVTHIGGKMYCDSRIKVGHIGSGVITEEIYLQTRGDNNG